MTHALQNRKARRGGPAGGVVFRVACRGLDRAGRVGAVSRLHKLIGNIEAEIILSPFASVGIAALVGFALGGLLI